MRAYPADPFRNSRAVFEAAVTGLSREDSLDHAELERRVEEHGRELMRALAQDHLDLRAVRERQARPEAVRGADGVARTEVRSSSRPLGMLFGGVIVRRLAFVKHGASGGLRPLDARLNLPRGLYSQGVQREVAWGVAQGSYEAVVDNLRRTTGTTIAKRQAEELSVALTADFEDFYLDRQREAERPNHLLVLTFDGSGVVMRPEGLRPATRKRARKATRTRSTAESAATGRPRRDERANRKRMAEVAAVYALEPTTRTPDDVMRELRRTGPHRARPRARNKRVWASLERPVDDVVDEAFCEALLRDEEFERHWVAVVDGNVDQLRAVHRMAANCGVQITVVVDLIHVLGYLWKAGKALTGDDIAETEAWVSERTGRILRGHSSQVAAGMRRSATMRRLDARARKPIDNCANYLLKYRSYLRYDQYLRDGLPIATGVIEGACRSVVKDRMDITGARWGLPGGEAVLKLRSLRASGDLDAYLAYHAQRQLERNHLVRYDEHELSDLREAA